jgi:hypothetical protein
MANIIRSLLTKRRIEKLPRFPLMCREVLNVMVGSRCEGLGASRSGLRGWE